MFPTTIDLQYAPVDCNFRAPSLIFSCDKRLACTIFIDHESETRRFEEQMTSSAVESANGFSVEGENTDESNSFNKAIIKERSKKNSTFKVTWFP